MRIFGKQVDVKVRSDLLGRLGMIIVSGILLVLVGVCSFAWFARNEQVNNSGLEVAVRTDACEILIERTTTYDSGYSVITDADYVKDSLAADGYSLTATSTASANLLAYELVNEYRYEDKYNLMPGAYGTLSFYLRPASSSSFAVNFGLSLGGYVELYDNEGDTYLEEVSSDVVLDLLKGHIMFFTERTGATYANYRYDGLIDAGHFTFDSSAHSLCAEPGKTDCYKVTLYWEWPITYYDIIDDLSTESVTARFPEEVGDYLDNAGYFFFGTPADATDDELSDAYNDGDQAIGNGTDCIVVYLAVL